MTEAEHLSEIYDDVLVDPDEFAKEVRHELRRDSSIYVMNRKAKKTGDKCLCPGPKCNRTFVKKSYQQAFCCKKCKDQFWNRVRFWRDEAKVEALMDRLHEMRYGDPDDGILTD